MNNNKENQKKRLIAIGLNPDNRPKLLESLQGMHCEISFTENNEQMWHILSKNDQNLAVIDGITTMMQLAPRLNFSCPWMDIVLISDETEPLAELHSHSEIADVLNPSGDCQNWRFHLDKVFKYNQIKQETVKLRQQVSHQYAYDNVIAQSGVMGRLMEAVQRIAPTDIAVLLTGEPGTGKQLLAKIMHNHSPRRRRPFFRIDCLAPSEEAFRQQLQSLTAKGIAAAIPEFDGGTLFFDGVENLSGEAQSNLLKFLQDHLAQGEVSANRLNMRIISTATASLEMMEKDFNPELWYRLSVFPLRVPSLAERREDLESLIALFLKEIAASEGRGHISISRSAVELLAGYHWPNNVHELENLLRRAVTLCRDNQIEIQDIIFVGEVRSDDLPQPPTAVKSALRKKSGLLNESQRSIIVKALGDNDWNFTQTAQELGIGRTTLWRKVKKYNLKRELSYTE